MGDSVIGSLRAGAGTLAARARQLLAGDADQRVARRMAGTAFLIRVFSAAILYVSHILLARWMGRYEFGIFVYVWTWVILASGLAPLGVAYSAQRFIPEYTAGNDAARLRGFLVASRALCLGLAALVALAGLALTLGFGERLGVYQAPFLIALACIPLLALASAQDGIARSYNWINVALVPGFVVQPILVLAAVAAAYLLHLRGSAAIAIGATAAAVWLTVFAQFVILERRLAAKVPPGPRQYEVKRWFATALPIFMVDSFYFLLTYTDILVLQLFVDPADIGVYYAATKTMVLITFIYYAVSAAFAHRFSESHFSGQREKLEAFITDAVRWTFWPSLAMALLLLALGKPILSLFGAGFSDGYPLLFVFVIGLLARASIGPAERLLIMVGQQRVCAAVYAAAFSTNLVVCFALVPWLGLMGAAISTAAAVSVESALLFVMAKRRLGLSLHFWR